MAESADDTSNAAVRLCLPLWSQHILDKSRGNSLLRVSNKLGAFDSLLKRTRACRYHRFPVDFSFDVRRPIGDESAVTLESAKSQMG